MSIEEAIAKLRQQWDGELHIDIQPSVVTVSNRSSAWRAQSNFERPKVYEGSALYGALNAAISGEGLE